MIAALAAMLAPGQVGAPRTSLQARIVDELARLGGRYPGALELLADRARPPGDPRTGIPGFNQWLCLSYRDEYHFLPVRPDFASRQSLLALCHFDHPKTLGIILRLQRNLEVQASLEAILDERPRLGPLEMPLWRPPLVAARRFFARSPEHRAEAACVLAEAGLQDGAALIGEAMAGEADGCLELLYRSCLLALGDETQRVTVRDAFLKAVKGKHRILNAIPPPAGYSLDIIYLAAHLLLCGDMEVLDVVATKERDLVSLSVFIEPFPGDLKAEGLGAWYESIVRGAIATAACGLEIDS
jgi:hypothetical protein